jgi:hypothetical protein
MRSRVNVLILWLIKTNSFQSWLMWTILIKHILTNLMHFNGCFWAQWNICSLKCWTFSNLMKITQTQSGIAIFLNKITGNEQLFIHQNWEIIKKQTMINNTIWLMINHFKIFDTRGRGNTTIFPEITETTSL